MNMRRRYGALALVAVVVLFSHPVDAVKTGGREAVVTFVQGTVMKFTGETETGIPVKRNDRLSKDHAVKVGKASRMEIRFSDGTVMRLSERSHLKLSEVSYNKKSGSKRLKVTLVLGKLWANVKKLLTPESTVEVKTANAVAGVRGTVYRVNVEEDTSAMVRVYEGSVYVAGAPRAVQKPATEVSGPLPVPGPHEVPPPYHEVTLEEWLVIVQAMQQVTVSPQGVASVPSLFTAEDDADEWVQWNRQRDTLLTF